MKKKFLAAGAMGVRHRQVRCTRNLTATALHGIGRRPIWIQRGTEDVMAVNLARARVPTGSNISQFGKKIASKLICVFHLACIFYGNLMPSCSPTCCYKASSLPRKESTSMESRTSAVSSATMSVTMCADRPLSQFGVAPCWVAGCVSSALRH